MTTYKQNSALMKLILNNFDIIIFSFFIVLIISAFAFKNIWLFSFSYIIAIIGYFTTFIPNLTRKNDDERYSFLYYRSNAYAFISTLIFILFWIFFNHILSGMFNFDINNILSILLCFAVSSYNFFYIFLKRKY